PCNRTACCRAAQNRSDAPAKAERSGGYRRREVPPTAVSPCSKRPLLEADAGRRVYCKIRRLWGRGSGRGRPRGTFRHKTVRASFEMTTPENIDSESIVVRFAG